MAEWLKRVMEEADRQFNELPEWKKTSADQFLDETGGDDERSSTTIREAYQRAENLR
jgi:hypothetical protein